MPPFAVAQLDEIPGVPCPCGVARRAFGDQPAAPASVHLVEIKTDAERHHHLQTTEIYVVLEGTGIVEVDDQRIPVRPLTTVMIPPGSRHRAIGNLRLLNIVVPPFNPRDEFPG